MRRALGGVLVVGFAIGLAGCGFGGPDPQPTADAAARALGRHDVHTVEFTGPDAKRATTDLAAMLDGMDQVPSTATASDVEEHGDSATATLTWHWDVAGRTWTTRSPMTLEKAGDAWHVVWRPSLVHPRLKPGQTLQANTLVAPRGDILGAHGAKIVTPRDVVRYGIDKVHVPHGDAVASARALATLVGVDPAGFAKRVRKAGEKAFVEAITLRSGSPDAPKDDAVRAIDGAAMVKAKLSAGTDAHVRRADPRHGRDTDRRDGEGEQGHALCGRPGRAQRSPGAVRRRAGRQSRRPGRPARKGRRDRADGAVPDRPQVRHGAHHHPRRARPEPRRTRARRHHLSERAGRGPALDRRKSSPPRAGRLRTATTRPPTRATHPARPSRSSAASPCCDPGSRRPRWWTVRPP